jgi:uncharacterized lipoprotein YddW (UPF0748 family)
MLHKLLITLLLFIIFSFQVFSQYIYPKREVRGAWIATVADIDWPSENNASSKKQITDLTVMLDKLAAAGINTLFFQVRTECDAFYQSQYEPWSYWLTGKQGKAPNPYYDPLAFIISEAHKRGMELHAWFNPYRAAKTTGEYEIASNHISKSHPEWILNFKYFKILNPGVPEVTHYIAKIVSDVVRRYDVDGIHFDDYFYPYSPRITTQDASTFAKFKGKFSNIDDWRRNNINKMVEEVYDSIKAIKPFVKFGISPFGIVENKYARTSGLDSYNVLYCDPITWLKDKTVDYILPQLYWEIGSKAADYASLLPWWALSAGDRLVLVGIYSTKMADPSYKGLPNELERQIKLSRQMMKTYGTVFFSAKSIVGNYSHFADSLKLYYKYPSLLPVMKWIDSVLPLTPINLAAEERSSNIILKWDKSMPASNGDTAYKYVIYRFDNEQQVNVDNAWHILKIQDGSETTFVDTTSEKGKLQYTYVVTALDRLNNESKPAVINLSLKGHR